MGLENLSLDELEEVIARCRDCQLHEKRTRAVPGEGSRTAEIMFIGEAPGWYEDQQGRPFVGPAGQFLNELLAMAGLQREGVYITNVVKCRPPGNRDPLPREIEACKKYLDRQIELINPRVIVSLGRYSLARFFPGESISKIHGTWRRQEGRVYFAMYHPAAALHQQSLRRVIQEDILKLPQALAEAQKLGPEESKPRQLNLF